MIPPAYFRYNLMRLLKNMSNPMYQWKVVQRTDLVIGQMRLP